jgi:tRNA A-37 threonylcarbamoyl transferase component Bud32
MSGPALHPLHAALLERWRGAPRPRDGWLARLLTEALRGDGQVLRLSERRVVLRMQNERGEWVLKLDAPRRRWEGVRRALRAGPALREARLATRLAGAVSGAPQPALGEEPAAGFGVFARPWIEGVSAEAAWTEEAERIGVGLARLHAAGWSDQDLSAADLILPAGGTMLPLDLAQARVERRGTTSAARRRADLVRLLASVPERKARDAAAGLLAGYARLTPPGVKAAEVLREAHTLRAGLLRRQSRRCLRECRDFAVTPNGVRRRENASGYQIELSFGSAKQAREAFQRLYELELHGLRAARPMELLRGGRIRVTTPAETEVAAGESEALLDLATDFLRAGFALGLERPEQFRRDAEGRVWMLDPQAVISSLH